MRITLSSEQLISYLLLSSFVHISHASANAVVKCITNDKSMSSSPRETCFLCRPPLDILYAPVV